MNKEERKAIEDMNRFANGIDMSCVTARQMQIILNLIEKLQKENEELKSNNEKYIIHLTDEQYKTVIENAQKDINQKWIQKVKDKIRYYQELQDNYIKKYDEINEGLQAMINVLQELLEGRK